jgi:hypothetical protein
MIVKGKVVDDLTNEPLFMAKIRAIKSDGTAIGGVGAYTDDKGRFDFNYPSDTFKVQITSVGYEPSFLNKFQISAGGLPTVFLKSKTLNTIVVTPKKSQLINSELKKTNWWLIGGISAVSIIGVGIAIYFYRKK